MKAKTFSDWLVESSNQSELQQIKEWLNSAPFYQWAGADLYQDEFPKTFSFFRAIPAQKYRNPLVSLERLSITQITQVGDSKNRKWVVGGEFVGGDLDEWDGDDDATLTANIDVDEAQRQVDNLSQIAIPVDQIESPIERLKALQYLRLGVLRKVANDHTVDLRWLEEAYATGDWEIMNYLATNPVTSTQILMEISHRFPELMKNLKQNPNWPDDPADWAWGEW
jgi:hypothetical protein